MDRRGIARFLDSNGFERSLGLLAPLRFEDGPGMGAREV